MENKLAFVIPTCSYNSEDKPLEDQHLIRVFLKSLICQKMDTKIKLYLGYNDDDKIYCDANNRFLTQGNTFLNPNITYEWIQFNNDYKGKPTHIWNVLTKKAIQDGYDYLYLCGDDISLSTDNGWFNVMRKSLKKNKNIGIAGGDSGNPNLPMTQFLIHKTHYEIFDFVFPPLIENWFCDNWIQEVYPNRYVNYFPQYRFPNLGGTPRYQPKDDEKLCSLLVKRYKSRVIHEINI
jgi:hypothetical protein